MHDRERGKEGERAREGSLGSQPSIDEDDLVSVCVCGCVGVCVWGGGCVCAWCVYVCVGGWVGGCVGVGMSTIIILHVVTSTKA